MFQSLRYLFLRTNESTRRILLLKILHDIVDVQQKKMTAVGTFSVGALILQHWQAAQFTFKILHFPVNIMLAQLPQI